jgi:ectoine hydroxylase-related dioxygenase (phytanoyl-CoA dioxygenase family)
LLFLVFNFPGTRSPVSWTSSRTNLAYYQQRCRHLHAVTGRRVFTNLHLYFGWAAELVSSPSLLDEVAAVIGNDIGVENSFLLIKPPNSEFGVPPHQDGINRRIVLPPEESVSAWLSITEATEENGCLRVFPGSHTVGYLDYGVADSNSKSLSGGRPLELTDAPSPETGHLVPLASGEAAIFSVCLVHDSGPNRSNSDRIGLNVRFVAGDADLITSDPRPVMMVRGTSGIFHEALFPSWSEEEGLARFMASLAS